METVSVEGGRAWRSVKAKTVVREDFRKEVALEEMW